MQDSKICWQPVEQPMKYVPYVVYALVIRKFVFLLGKKWLQEKLSTLED